MTQNRIHQMMQMYENGATLRQVAKEFDISHERVRQLFDNRDPEFTARIATKRKQEKIKQRAVREQEKENERKRPKGVCRICGENIYRPRAKYTCSPDHQKIWNKIKLHIDPSIRQDHIVAEAKVIKASEEKYTNSQIKWANKVLENSESGFKPHSFVPQSEAHAAFVEWQKEFGHKVKVPDSHD